MTATPLPPILPDKDHDAPSAFTPESLLREARRQKGAEATAVPSICVLDPDGDIVRHLVHEGRARPEPGGSCYHTELHVFDRGDDERRHRGLRGRRAFAVLVAEELFASGCELLISITSARGRSSVQASRRPTSC